MERYFRLFQACQELRKEASAGQVAQKAWKGVEYVAGKGPLVGKGFEHAVKGAPFIGAAYLGVKGYKGGKRKIQEYKMRRRIRKLQKMRGEY